MKLRVGGASADRVLGARQAAEDELLNSVAAQSLTAASGTEGFGFENIVGVGVSERTIGSRPTGEPAVAVYVMQKAPRDMVDQEALVPPRYEGIPTTVIETGEFVIATERGRHRPASSGLSIGHSEGDTGTLGFLATNSEGLFIVSNNHVLARENAADAGDAIVQPGVVDGGTSDDQIAELSDWVPLNFNGNGNSVDAAKARVEEGTVSCQPYGGGKIVTDPGQPTRNSVVRKCGRTTGLSRGVIYDVNGTIKVRYASGTLLLRDQVLIQGLAGKPFSDQGDSGSLVVDDATNQPVGLLCGGSPQFSLANQIDLVLRELGVSLAS